MPLVKNSTVLILSLIIASGLCILNQSIWKRLNQRSFDQLFKFNDGKTNKITITEYNSVDEIFPPLQVKSLYERLQRSNKNSFDKNIENLLKTTTIQKLAEVTNIKKKKFDQKFNYSARHDSLSITNQERSGTCWIFAFLNMLRCPFAKIYNLDKWEFSSSYFAYWITIERYNTYFTSLSRMLENNISTESTFFRYLIAMTVSDGGTWQMATNIIRKYGLLPKTEFPSTYSSENTYQLSQLLRRLMVLHTSRIQEAFKKNRSTTEAVKRAVFEVQGVMTLAYGIPPENFTWKVTKKGSSTKYVNISAVNFAKQIQSHIDVFKMVTFSSDDRRHLKKNQGYLTPLTGLFTEKSYGFVCNVDIHYMEKAIVSSIKDKVPVWISLDFNRFTSRSQSVLDLDVFDYKLVFRRHEYPFLNKTNRDSFRSSFGNHAVLLTEVATDGQDNPRFYRLENSHGVVGDEKGYLLMTKEWFRQFGSEVVVNEKYMPKETRKCLDEPSILLPFWDKLNTVVFA